MGEYLGLYPINNRLDVRRLFAGGLYGRTIVVGTWSVSCLFGTMAWGLGFPASDQLMLELGTF